MHQPLIYNFQLYLVDTSYDPSYDAFSDQFKYHSLYETQAPVIHYESLGSELAVFLSEEDRKYFTDPDLRKDVIDSLISPYPENQYAFFVSKANIFKKLDLYSELQNKSGWMNYHLFKNINYCDEADMLHLLDPTQLFEHYKIMHSYGERK